MSPRARVAAIVAAAAALAALLAVAGAVLTAEEVPGPPPGARAAEPRPGFPPLVLDLGVRDDAEARDLRRASALYEAGRRAPAGRIFARYDSLEARVGKAFAAWPDDSLNRLEQLGGLFPRSALVQLHAGLARLWAGKGDPAAAWREAASVEPDTPYAVRAGDLLHPDLAPGLPTFLPTRPLPAGLARLPVPEQLRRLELAGRRSPLAALYYGVALQRLGRPVSARRQFAALAQRDPNDVDALVADAVGRFDKAGPEKAFSRLGPLTRRFPRSATVRFHLGLLLLWTGRVEEARRQLRLARRAEPGSRHAREAERYLDRLEGVGTG